MGKVYEALKKAEVEGHPAGWSSIAVEAMPIRTSTPRDRNNGAPNGDFIDYSLNAFDAVEIEERNREMAAAQASRKLLTQPSREVTIDTAHIASQLTSFSNLDTDSAEEYNRLAVTLITAAGE